MTRPLSWYLLRPFTFVLGLLLLLILYPILGARELWRDMTRPPPRNPNSLWPPVQSPGTAKIMRRMMTERFAPLVERPAERLNTGKLGMGDWLELNPPQGAAAHGDWTEFSPKLNWDELEEF